MKISLDYFCLPLSTNLPPCPFLPVHLKTQQLLNLPWCFWILCFSLALVFLCSLTLLTLPPPRFSVTLRLWGKTGRVLLSISLTLTCLPHPKCLCLPISCQNERMREIDRLSEWDHKAYITNSYMYHLYHKFLFIDCMVAMVSTVDLKVSART